MIKSTVISPTMLRVKGGLKSQKEFRENLACELREYFEENRCKYITTEEMRNFFAQRFPKLNISITNKRHPFPLMGTAEQHFDAKTLNMSGCEIKVASNTLLDKLKGVFGIKPHKDEFYVDGKFAKVMIHESTHMFQHFMNPYYSAYLKGVNKIAKGNSSELKDIIARRDKLYSSLIYNEDVLPVSPKVFRKSLKLMLKEASYEDDNLALLNLKTIIRDLENEKEAYEVCEKQLEHYCYPELKDNEKYNDYISKKYKSELEGRFGFDVKLKIMRQEYFRLVNKIRLGNENK